MKICAMSAKFLRNTATGQTDLVGGSSSSTLCSNDSSLSAREQCTHCIPNVDLIRIRNTPVTGRHRRTVAHSRFDPTWNLRTSYCMPAPNGQTGTKIIFLSYGPRWSKWKATVTRKTAPSSNCYGKDGLSILTVAVRLQHPDQVA
jgi:hypothetical protein